MTVGEQDAKICEQAASISDLEQKLHQAQVCFAFKLAVLSHHNYHTEVASHMCEVWRWLYVHKYTVS